MRFECICIAMFSSCVCVFFSFYCPDAAELVPFCACICVWWMLSTCMSINFVCVRTSLCVCVCRECMHESMRERQLNLLNSIELINKILFRFFLVHLRTQDTLKSMQLFKCGNNNFNFFIIYSTELHVGNSRSLFSSEIFSHVLVLFSNII